MPLCRAICSALAATFLVALLTGLTGCASTPQASLERDDQAKQFGTAPAVATVYVFRPDASPDDSVLWLDGRLIGATLPRSYFRVHLDPGRHTLAGMAADNGRFMIDVRPGEVYFVQLTLSGQQSVFQSLPTETGRKAVINCCSLMENWAPGQRPLLR